MQLKENNTIRARFSDWFSGQLGKRVSMAEESVLEGVLADMFGYHILQCGYPAGVDYIKSSNINDKTFLFLDQNEIDRTFQGIYVEVESLPIATDSIDVVVLPHVLEYSKDVHKLLREIDRVLIGDGQVVIFSINPFSLWGIWHLFFCWWDKMPWAGRLISISKLKDWLSLLNYEVKKTKSFFFLPPFENDKVLSKLMPLERLGRYCWPIFGGLYIVVAEKRSLPLSLFKKEWRAKNKILVSGAVEPSIRNSLKIND